ncbi:ester cyclase [Amycolatopsis acidicola]|nr:ester cyclase [Amycolatopsis acidicola]
MTPDEIRVRARRITEEVLNQGDLAALGELVEHGADELAGFVTTLRRAFPDLRAHTEQQIVEGDTLVQRLTVTGTHDGAPFAGLPANGATLRVDLIACYRVGASGRFTSRWTLWDEHAVRTQLRAGPRGSRTSARLRPDSRPRGTPTP